MKTADDYRVERDELGARLAEVENLAATLSVISDQLEQIEARGELHLLRNAVVGLSRALTREIERDAA
ncbi:MAG: hypothetical protein ACK41U_15715 [Paracoccus sp. (in: a-proteobacteria)]|uniref:hypothetical protein n=1 Tax=Paracoccus sp. TaxID=267 RepID=UPI003919A5CF